MGFSWWTFRNRGILCGVSIRETKEETGIEIANVSFILLGNIPDTYATHYVAIGFSADWKSGEPVVLEPTKCERWEWCDLHDLPQPLFFPAKMIIDAYLSGIFFRDCGTVNGVTE